MISSDFRKFLNIFWQHVHQSPLKKGEKKIQNYPSYVFLLKPPISRNLNETQKRRRLKLFQWNPWWSTKYTESRIVEQFRRTSLLQTIFSLKRTFPAVSFRIVPKHPSAVTSRIAGCIRARNRLLRKREHPLINRLLVLYIIFIYFDRTPLPQPLFFFRYILLKAWLGVLPALCT